MNTRLHILEGGILDFDPDFLTKEEADTFLSALTTKVEWEAKHYTHRITGEKIPQPRLTAWYADSNGMEYKYSGVVQVVQPWLPELLAIKDKIEAITGAKYNSVLLNQYRNGNDSVGLHADDEKAFGINANIASVSLGDTRAFFLRRNKSGSNPDFQVDEKTNQEKAHLFELSHGSLLVMSGTTQHYWKHEVPKTKLPVGPRVNLTYRWFNPPEGE